MKTQKKEPVSENTDSPGSISIQIKRTSQALLTDPKSSIFSLTVALIASVPGARSLRGSNPLPCSSLPSSIYLRVAAANASGILY